MLTLLQPDFPSAVDRLRSFDICQPLVQPIDQRLAEQRLIQLVGKRMGCQQGTPPAA